MHKYIVWDEGCLNDPEYAKGPFDTIEAQGPKSAAVKMTAKWNDGATLPILYRIGVQLAGRTGFERFVVKWEAVHTLQRVARRSRSKRADARGT